MASVVVLLNRELQLTDFYVMNIVGRETLIVFTDEQKLEEVLAAVGRWAANDDSKAAALDLEAETVEQAERLLTAMSPSLASTRFVPDTDPVVDRLLAHIRGG